MDDGTYLWRPTLDSLEEQPEAKFAEVVQRQCNLPAGQ